MNKTPTQCSSWRSQSSLGIRTTIPTIIHLTISTKMPQMRFCLIDEQLDINVLDGKDPLIVPLVAKTVDKSTFLLKR
ncbi:hypothetical protein KUTeg_020253 [Tegillarca granosa]|uniref:Uncharacterized protein n=1 Tax=Tegillarca granosa TaxID=220873 RepID=A0ABQ9E7A3_TEGGR|nr:hypothetical protein KUTeg_020253 [Tegillarca granosa]